MGIFTTNPKEACCATNCAASVHQPYLCSVLWLCSKQLNSIFSLLNAFVPLWVGEWRKEACSMWRTVNMAVYGGRSCPTWECWDKVAAANTCYVLVAGLLKRRHERGKKILLSANKWGFSRKSQHGDKHDTTQSAQLVKWIVACLMWNSITGRLNESVEKKTDKVEKKSNDLISLRAFIYKFYWKKLGFTEKSTHAFGFIKSDCRCIFSVLPAALLKNSAAGEGGRELQPSDLYTGFLRVTELTLK